MPLTDEQGTLLVRLARSTVDNAVNQRATPESENFDAPFLRELRGAFVTLNQVGGGLRGCIGLPYPVKELGEAVVEGAIGAATGDPRFPQVQPKELDGLVVEVSALTKPELLTPSSPRQLPELVRIGTDGLIVSGLGYSGLLLPQVATEYKLQPVDFLSETCLKAGLMPDAWLTEKVRVQRFQAEVFGETSPRGSVKREMG